MVGYPSAWIITFCIVCALPRLSPVLAGSHHKKPKLVRRSQGLKNVLFGYFPNSKVYSPVPVTARIAIPPGTWMSVVSVVCWQVQDCATGWSLIQRSPTECDVSSWVRLWILDNEGALVHCGLLRHLKKKCILLSVKYYAVVSTVVHALLSYVLV